MQRAAKRPRDDLSRQYPERAYLYRTDSLLRVALTPQESKMSIGVLQYNWKISATIRKARIQGAVSQQEADYLDAMATASSAASSTLALINARGAPDFLYAALYFSTSVWQSKLLWQIKHRETGELPGL